MKTYTSPKTSSICLEADANVIFGALVDETLGDNISITVLATGFTEKSQEKEMRAQLDVLLEDSAYSNIRAAASRAPPRESPIGGSEEEDASSQSASPLSSRKAASNSKVPGFLRNLKRR